MFYRPGRLAMVQLSDGTSLQGVTCWAWPGRIRLRDAIADGTQVDGKVTVYARAVLLVQVVPR
jgi:hypothetical protein